MDKALKVVGHLLKSGQLDLAERYLRDAAGMREPGMVMTRFGFTMQEAAMWVKLARARGDAIMELGYIGARVPDPASYSLPDIDQETLREIARHGKEAAPRIIHQIWIGPKPCPPWPRQVWQEWCDRYQYSYMLWDEAALDSAGISSSPAFRHYMGRSVYAGAADVARAEILVARGGLYVDMDILPIDRDASIHDLLPLMGVACMPAARFKNLGLGSYDFRNGVLSSTVGNPILRRYAGAMDRSVEQTPDMPAWWTVGGSLLTSSISGAVTLLEPRLIAEIATINETEARSAYATAVAEQKAVFFMWGWKDKKRRGRRQANDMPHSVKAINDYEPAAWNEIDDAALRRFDWGQLSALGHVK